MATTTTNLGLTKPDYTDAADIAVINTNMDTVDTAITATKSDLGIVEDGNTATHSITAGQYVIWKGNLYTAKSAIATGTTLSTSNLTAVSNGGLNSLNDHIAEFASTVYNNWSRMTGHESGTTLEKTSWTSIAYQRLPAGTYYVSCCIYMATTQTSASLYHRILINDISNVAIQDAINAKSRTMPLATIIKLSAPSTIYLQAYTSDANTTVNAHICSAIKLF